MDAGQLPRPPRISSYQLIVNFHEDCYQREFAEADMSGYVYRAAKVDRLTVEKRVPLPPPTQPQQQGQQQQTHGRYAPPQQRQQQQQRPQRQPWAEGGVDDAHLTLAHASNASYKVCLDRRLRPVMLAVHKTAAYPLPSVGVRAGGGGGGAGGGAGGGGGGAGGGPGELGLRNQRDVRQLEDAMQNLADLMFRERMSSVLLHSSVAQPPPPQPPLPPLVVLANEGDWRDSRVIHLKAPVDGAAEYLRLLRALLSNAGYVLKNQNDDCAALESVLSHHHDNLTAPFTAPEIQPFVSNRPLLGDAQPLLDQQPGAFFRVPDAAGQLAGGGGLGAVWYGCRKLPRLVATLPGRSLNGLGLQEVLGCMEALWESDLKRRMFEPLSSGVQKTAGLSWVLVPCLA